MLIFNFFKPDELFEICHGHLRVRQCMCRFIRHQPVVIVLHHLRDCWAILALFVAVVGRIYAGVFSPTEAVGISAAAILLLPTLSLYLTTFM